MTICDEGCNGVHNAQRITSEILQHFGANNLTIAKFVEKMTAHLRDFATARTQSGEVSDV